MTTIRFRPLVFICTVILSATALAANKPDINTSKNDLAVRGYDVVAYRTEGKPTPGSPSFEYRWKNAVWRFTTAEHRDLFAKAPDRYAPEFGGYCAYAVSRGYTADGDPAVWRLVDGRLYLNYSVQAREMWEKDVPGNIAKGRQNWPGVLMK
jgi:hypothetical protein